MGSGCRDSAEDSGAESRNVVRLPLNPVPPFIVNYFVSRRGLSILAASALAVLLANWRLRPYDPDFSAIDVSSAAGLEREFEELRKQLDIPGLSIVIAERGRIVWARGFGWADLERNIPIVPETTSFHLASVTKPIAAAVVLQLADEGRLDLDAPVARFGIDLPRSQPVRVWHILSHTSDEPPGAAFRYDPRVFGSLTQLVERVTGRPFAAELTDRIVRRLRLEHTGPNPRELDWTACRSSIALVVLRLCGSSDEAQRWHETFTASGLDRAKLEADLAVGYARRWGRLLWPAGLFGSMHPEQHLTNLFASAGLIASASDLARFSIALDEGAVLKDSTRARAFMAVRAPDGKALPYGLGWFVQEHGAGTLIWHFGQAFESSALIVKIPARQLTFIALANSDGLSRRRRLGDRADVLASPAARLFLRWLAVKSSSARREEDAKIDAVPAAGLGPCKKLGRRLFGVDDEEPVIEAKAPTGDRCADELDAAADVLREKGFEADGFLVVPERRRQIARLQRDRTDAAGEVVGQSSARGAARKEQHVPGIAPDVRHLSMEDRRSVIGDVLRPPETDGELTFGGDPLGQEVREMPARRVNVEVHLIVAVAANEERAAKRKQPDVDLPCRILRRHL
jgi:CubicO group peptidase (beta-lactamase class C family)